MQFSGVVGGLGGASVGSGVLAFFQRTALVMPQELPGRCHVQLSSSKADAASSGQPARSLQTTKPHAEMFPVKWSPPLPSSCQYEASIKAQVEHAEKAHSPHCLLCPYVRDSRHGLMS